MSAKIKISNKKESQNNTANVKIKISNKNVTSLLEDKSWRHCMFIYTSISLVYILYTSDSYKRILTAKIIQRVKKYKLQVKIQHHNRKDKIWQQKQHIDSE